MCEVTQHHSICSALRSTDVAGAGQGPCWGLKERGRREVRPGWVSLDTLSPCFPALSPAHPSLGQAEGPCSWTQCPWPSIPGPLTFKIKAGSRDPFRVRGGHPPAVLFPLPRSLSDPTSSHQVSLPRIAAPHKEKFVHTLATIGLLAPSLVPLLSRKCHSFATAVPLPFPPPPASHPPFNTHHRCHPAFPKAHTGLVQNHQNCVSGLFLQP